MNLNHLASYGRHGDTEIAHLTPGELVIPVALQTPELIREFVGAASDQGIDPVRYMVNSGIASVNPQTGMQEFFLEGLLGDVLGSVVNYGINALFGGGGATGSAASGTMSSSAVDGMIGGGGGPVGGGGGSGNYSQGTPAEASGMGNLLPRLLKGGLGALIGHLLNGDNDKGEMKASELQQQNENTYPNVRPYNLTRAPMQGIAAIPSQTGGEAQYFNG